MCGVCGAVVSGERGGPLWRAAIPVTSTSGRPKSAPARPTVATAVLSGTVCQHWSNKKAARMADDSRRISIVRAGDVWPGRGRNVGIEAMRAPWILLIDAGLCVDKSLVEMLTARPDANFECRIVLGSRRVQADSRWWAAATITGIRARECVEGPWCRFELAPCLLERRLWVEVGGLRDWRASEDLDCLRRLAISGPRILKAPRAEVEWDLAVDRRRLFRKWRVHEYHNAVHGTSWHRPVFVWNSIGVVQASIGTIAIRWASLVFLLGPHVARSAARYRRHRWRGDDEVGGGPFVFLQAVAVSVLLDVATLWGYMDYRVGRPPREW